MTLIAYDSDNISDIPKDAGIIAYYNDNEIGTATAEQLATFPSARKYPISRKAGIKTYWLDVENGAASIQDFINDFRAGLCKGIYIGASRITTELEPACVAQDVNGYDLWAANWGATGLYPGSVWTQFASPTSTIATQGHYDTSFVWSNWEPKGENNVSPEPSGHTLVGPIVAAVATPSGNGYWLFGSDGGVFAFGDAKDHGSIPAIEPKVTLTRPIFDAFTTKSGNGYTLVAMDGGIFCFGDAVMHGSIPEMGIGPAPELPVD